MAKKMILVLVAFLYMILFMSKAAFAGPCTIKQGGFNYIVNYNFDSTVNDTGFKTGWQEKESVGSYDFSGSCSSSKKSIYWSGSPSDGLVRASSNLGRTWYEIPGNEYLQVAVDIGVWDSVNAVNNYHSVPFLDVSNRCGEKQNGCKGSASTGSKSRINIRIAKPFVGNAYINREIAYLSGNSSRGEGSRQKIVGIYLISSITVPESCELDAGETITMDFGDIGAPSFSQAGAGNRPAGINPQTKNIGIKCKNMDAQAMLSMRLEADKVSGNVMVSDNKDVGFIIADVDHKPLTPNNIDSKIPFRLDDNFSATVPVSAWPVSVTGNKPAEGKFTAAGYLRVDFD